MTGIFHPSSKRRFYSAAILLQNFEDLPRHSGACNPRYTNNPGPAASVLDIVGDKWTLLVVRDISFGKHTFGELQDSMEHIPTNILADRLKRLLEADIIRREPYQQKPVRYRYELTGKGRDLRPIMLSMGEWANKYLPGTARIGS